jgi:phytoene synthase
MIAAVADRAALVEASGEIISKGSKSFRSASRLFDSTTRERSWLLYAWCRACDDMTDGQTLGHDARAPLDPAAGQAHIERLTKAALAGESTGETPFDALGLVAAEVVIPTRTIDDHLTGFALDAKGWTPANEQEMLAYCYYVAGAVGSMMAAVMGVDPSDRDTLDRASDLGIAFQLANIARDIVPDAREGRVYLPRDWLIEAGLDPADPGSIASPAARKAVASLAKRLVDLSRSYRRSARIGAARLPFRARLAVLAAANVYGAIGEKVVRRGAHAWDSRTIVSKGEKLLHFSSALAQAMLPASASPRADLWTAPA